MRAVAYGSYEGGLRDLIHLLKYEEIRPAADALGEMLNVAVEPLLHDFESNEVLIIPVPLHKKKLRQRGFNQTELIVRAALRARTDDPQFRLNLQLLERRRETISQIGLSQNQRRENLRGAFVVGHPEQIRGREILLVDDVFTTGTTVSECARVLTRAGASAVWVATVGRTLKRNTQPFGIDRVSEDDLATAAEA